jgi:tRNA-splicing ligase RtcB
MPDAHLGYGLPIGGVVKTDRVVVPSWVGYDIGCGVCNVPIEVPNGFDERSLRWLYDAVNRIIPMGFDKHINYPVDGPDNYGLTSHGLDAYHVRNAVLQYGTLGGGNHFIELGKDSQGNYSFTIHSGSRGVGHEIASTYMRLASPDGKRSEGNFGFERGEDLYVMYLKDMKWCLEYALGNRLAMLKIIEAEMQDICDLYFDWPKLINKNHNHAEEMLDGSILHRKGATSATLGEYGVIPGNMRDGTAIVKGLGNPDSLFSCSHGAGRRYGRKEAGRALKLDDFQEDMQGVVANVSQKHIDEAPRAYKDFFEVLKQQEDLALVEKFYKPVINWKA